MVYFWCIFWYFCVFKVYLGYFWLFCFWKSREFLLLFGVMFLGSFMGISSSFFGYFCVFLRHLWINFFSGYFCDNVWKFLMYGWSMIFFWGGGLFMEYLWIFFCFFVWVFIGQFWWFLVVFSCYFWSISCIFGVFWGILGVLCECFL